MSLKSSRLTSMRFVLTLCCSLCAVAECFDPLTDQTIPFTKTVDRFYRYLTDSRNQICAGNARQFERALEDGQSWALKMADASGRPQSGFSLGSLTFPGLFSQCLKIVVENDTLPDDPITMFTGQYCLARFTLTGQETPPGVWNPVWDLVVNSTISQGLCFPSNCDQHEANLAIVSALSSVFQGAELSEISLNCNTKDTKFNPSPGTIIVMFVLLFLIVLSIVGTLFDTRKSIDTERKPILSSTNENTSTMEITNNASTDVLYQSDMKEKKSKWSRVLLAFSARQNGSAILDTTSPGGAIVIFNGIRFLSTAWIIILHSFAFAFSGLTFQNPDDARLAPAHFLSQIYANGTFAVDTFLYMSGFLQSYLSSKQWSEKAKSTKPHLAIAHRYIRMTPLMMIIVAFYSTVLPWLGNGPFWNPSVETAVGMCRNNWWINAIYLQNFINTPRMCFGHTWYNAVDFQLFIVVHCTLLPLLNRKRIIGFSTLICFLVVSVGLTIYLTLVNHLPGVLYLNNGPFPQDSLNTYSSTIYIKPYFRLSAYLIGVAMGHFLYSTRGRFTLTRFYVISGWFLTLSTFGAVIFSTWPAYEGTPFTVGGETAYGALSKIGWAFALSWMTYACVENQGGLIAKFLSWKFFVPLSKLSYCAYLVHPILLTMFYNSRQISYDFSVYFMIYVVVGNIVLTFAVSFVLSVLFEAPFAALDKTFLKSR